jgi:hypothetical protein
LDIHRLETIHLSDSTMSDPKKGLIQESWPI